MSQTNSATGRVAVITGAGRGIGAAIAENLRDAGYRVVSFDMTDAAPEGVLGVACNVTDADSVDAAFKKVEDELGPDGIRCNLVAAGPVDTIAKKAIPGASSFNDVWEQRAPLGWDAKDATPVAKAVVALLSDWFPATTGTMVHVDGGLHSTGA